MPSYIPPFGQYGATAGAAAGGAGGSLLGTLGSILSPLDYPRQALWNAVRAGGNALSGEGTWDDALRAVPGALGAGLAGGLMATGVGAPLGILAGSALGGLAQGIGKSADEEKFAAPEVKDLTGTEDFLPNMLVGALTDPLTYAGGIGGAARGAQVGRRVGTGIEQAALARGPEFAGGAEKLAEALGAGGRTGEMAERLAASPEAARVLGELPHGSSLFSDSNNALAFRTPGGDVTRIAGGEALPASRANIPEMLQPNRNVEIGNYRVEHLPFAAQVGDRQLYGQSYGDLAGGVRAQGFHPADLAPQNVGSYGGKPVLIDPGAVVPHPRAMGPFPVAESVQAQQPSRMMNLLLDILGTPGMMRSRMGGALPSGAASGLSPLAEALGRVAPGV